MKTKPVPKPTFSTLEAVCLSSIAITLLCLIWHFMTYYGSLIEGGIKY